MENASSESSHDEHEDMDHSGSTEVPEGLREAENPAYPPGSKAQIIADHMPGMNGEEVTNHKLDTKSELSTEQ
ncbi:hypothetical protein [Halobacillus alkaliphilus]|uniref:hypothetical protein n=1 Tax=Halobacillus alkaliphilus TaxID=396056 RepID=UPI000B7DB366|nr:hypothetical protein [Halobacillus alkaliphilus]